MAVAARGDRRGRLFLWAGLAAVAAAAIGFFRTFLLPSWEGRFQGPFVVHVHGAFVSAWLLLFASQAGWVQAGNVRMHRRLGLLAAVVAPGVVASTIAMGVFVMHRDLAAGLGEIATSSLVGTITSSLIFVALVAAGLHWRRDPATHKRLMLLATVAILWPAFFRFRHYFPSAPHPEWVFGFLLSQLFLLAVVVADRGRLGRIHPVWSWVGVPFSIEAALETWLFDSPGWRVVAHALADLLA